MKKRLGSGDVTNETGPTRAVHVTLLCFFSLSLKLFIEENFLNLNEAQAGMYTGSNRTWNRFLAEKGKPSRSIDTGVLVSKYKKDHRNKNKNKKKH